MPGHRLRARLRYSTGITLTNSAGRPQSSSMALRPLRAGVVQVMLDQDGAAAPRHSGSCRALMSTRPVADRSPAWCAKRLMRSSSAAIGSRSTIAMLQRRSKPNPRRAHRRCRPTCRPRIAPGLAEHHDDAAGHILAAMIAGAFDDGDGARIAYGEALAGNAPEIAFAGDGAVEHGVADDDALLRHDAGSWPEALMMRPPRDPCRHSRWHPRLGVEVIP